LRRLPDVDGWRGLTEAADQMNSAVEIINGADAPPPLEVVLLLDGLQHLADAAADFATDHRPPRRRGGPAK
jgi:hypothetical protein